TVLGAGMPLLEAVRISTGVLKNTFIKERLDRVGKELERGGGFAEALAASGVFPSLAVRMISAGENSGSLGQVLNDLAEFYEEDVNTRLAVLTSAIEPTLMIVMGALIGLVVLAMYLPIFQLASVAI
ncbi:MAG TPA: type II secretion system F family protein, partial [Desulfobacterales bacterium]|nr:type II secretion system F family protein [Desulfobacterales bacterium]